MFNNWVDKVNGYGVWFRFILPIMLGLLIWNFNTRANEFERRIEEINVCVKEAMQDRKEIRLIVESYFSNHLTHHASFEKSLEGRLTRIETILEEIR